MASVRLEIMRLDIAESTEQEVAHNVQPCTRTVTTCEPCHFNTPPLSNSSILKQHTLQLTYVVFNRRRALGSSFLDSSGPVLQGAWPEFASPRTWSNCHWGFQLPGSSQGRSHLSGADPGPTGRRWPGAGFSRAPAACRCLLQRWHH